jgi:diguanylate cyclase (GGDEF)-like protein
MAILSQAAPAARLPDWISGYTLDINILISMGAIGFSLAKYKSTVIENEKVLKKLTLKLARAANTDELTTIPNRRHIHQILSSSIENFDLTTDKFIVALVDVDDFKAINDQFGHDCGDRVLKEISLRMKSCLRKNDKIGRWGGEEFLVFLPNTEFPHGIEIIDRMRKTIGEKPFVTGDTSTVVTITAGVAEFHPETNLQDIINLADKRLYNGKRNGKNCVVGHDEDL